MAKEPANPLLEDDWEEIVIDNGEEWDFDKNSTLVGQYTGTDFIDIPEAKQRKNEDGTTRTRAMIYKFTTGDDGTSVFVWESYQMNEAMKEVEIGNLVKIQFDGYRKFDSANGPRQVKTFKVSVKRNK